MDLDKLKQEWKQSDEIQTNLNEEQVLEMLSKKGKSSLSKLIQVEKFFFIMSIILFPIIPFFWVAYSPLISIAFAVLYLPALPWIRYKVRLLKSFDICSSSILETAQKINKYRKSIVGELIISIPWYITIAILCTYDQLEKTKINHNAFLIVATSVWVIGFVIVMLIYWGIYRKHIKAIQKANEEIKSFQSEDE